MGNTYPGAALPFGMMQWSPETTTGFIKHDGSYFYGDDGIRGFSLNHLSGPGCPIMGDVLIQPVVGALAASPAKQRHRLFGEILPQQRRGFARILLRGL